MLRFTVCIDSGGRGQNKGRDVLGRWEWCILSAESVRCTRRSELTRVGTQVPRDLRWDGVQAWSWWQMGVGKALQVLQSDLGDCIWLGSNHQLLPSPHTQMAGPTLSSSSCVGWQSFLHDCVHLSAAEVADMLSTFPGSEPPVLCSFLCVLPWICTRECMGLEINSNSTREPWNFRRLNCISVLFRLCNIIRV